MVRTVYRKPTLRMSELVALNVERTEVFVYPLQDIVNKMLASGVLHHLVGFENDFKEGSGRAFTFLLSNLT